MITANETQWVSGLTTDDPTDSYTLMHETGTPVAHIQRHGNAWQGFWYDGTPAGFFKELANAMDFLEQPAPECAGRDCDSLPAVGMAYCWTCLYGAENESVRKDWV